MSHQFLDMRRKNCRKQTNPQKCPTRNVPTNNISLFSKKFFCKNVPPPFIPPVVGEHQPPHVGRRRRGRGGS
jgi:hypothetical protein